MNLWDILILLAVTAAAAAAVIRSSRRRKTGKGCCGTCEGCALNCRSRQNSV